MIKEALILGLAIGVMAITVSKTHAFAWLRMLVWERARLNKRATVNGWEHLSAFITCPYCLSHWFAIAGVLIYDVRLIEAWIVLDYFVSAMAVTAIATFTGAVLYRAYQPPVRERVQVARQDQTTGTDPRGST